MNERRKALNGDTKVIVDIMRGLHKENKDDISKLFEKLSKLPCTSHEVKIEGHDSTRKWFAGTILTVTCCVIAFAVAWGTLLSDVKNHHEVSTKRLDACCGEEN